MKNFSDLMTFAGIALLASIAVVLLAVALFAILAVAIIKFAVTFGTGIAMFVIVTLIVALTYLIFRAWHRGK